MNEGIISRSVMYPLTKPIAMPKRIAPMTATGTDWPNLIRRLAMRTDVTPLIEATERSISATRRTNETASARRLRTTDCMRMLLMFRGLRNTSDCEAKNTQRTTSPERTGISGLSARKSTKRSMVPSEASSPRPRSLMMTGPRIFATHHGVDHLFGGRLTGLEVRHVSPKPENH